MLEKVEKIAEAEMGRSQFYDTGFQRRVTDDTGYLLLNGKNHLTNAVSLGQVFFARARRGYPAHLTDGY